MLNKFLSNDQRESLSRRMLLTLEDVSKEVLPDQGFGR